MLNTNLTTEQQFNTIAFASQVDKMSGEQARTMLVDFYRLSLEKENSYKKLVAHNWGLTVDVVN